MRLRDDLKVLAHAAPPPPAPDELLDRAQAIRHRRATIVPAVAVVAVLVLTITYLSRVDAAGPTMMLSFSLERPSEPGVVELDVLDPRIDRASEILRERARLLGLNNPRTRVLEGGAILLEYEGGGDGIDLHQLAAPGNLQVRKVIDLVGIFDNRAPAPSASSSTEASTLDGLIAKLGRVVYSRALNLTSEGDPQLLPGFESLTRKEVAMLPLSTRFYVPTISCDQLAPGTPPPGQRAVTCQGSHTKMLLDAAALTGGDLAEATTIREQLTGRPAVQLHLKTSGKSKWSTVSAEAANRVGCTPVSTVVPENHCLLAFLIDGEVVTAPQILRRLNANEATLSFASVAEARVATAKLGPRELPPGIKLAA